MGGRCHEITEWVNDCLYIHLVFLNISMWKFEYTILVYNVKITLALGQVSIMKPSIFSKLSDLMENISYRYWLITAAVVSILLGILVFFGLSSNSSTPEPATRAETVQGMVATQDIAPKATIQSAMIKAVNMPKELVPEDAVTNSAEIVGKPANIQIMKGDIITTKKVLMDIRMAGFIGLIPSDCRAVSVAINDVTGVAGFAKPGDYVDIMVVTGGNDDRKVSSNLLLQNVLLLAINKNHIDETANTKGKAENGDTTKENKDSKENIKNNMSAPATATLAVTPKDAMKLVAGAHSGTLYLVLRPYKPINTFTTHTEFSMTNKSLRQPVANPTPSQPVYNSQPAEKPPAAAPAPAKPSGTVEVIRGTTITREGA